MVFLSLSSATEWLGSVKTKLYQTTRESFAIYLSLKRFVVYLLMLGTEVLTIQMQQRNHGD